MLAKFVCICTIFHKILSDQKVIENLSLRWLFLYYHDDWYVISIIKHCQKLKVSFWDFFSKCKLSCRYLRLCSDSLKKFIIEVCLCEVQQTRTRFKKFNTVNYNTQFKAIKYLEKIWNIRLASVTLDYTCSIALYLILYCDTAWKVSKCPYFPAFGMRENTDQK